MQFPGTTVNRFPKAMSSRGIPGLWLEARGRLLKKAVLAFVALLCLLSCGTAPRPLPLLSSLEGKGVIHTVANFIVIGLDVPNDGGGLDGKLDYFFLFESDSADEVEIPSPAGLQPLRVELNKSLGQLQVQAGESFRLQFHVPRSSEVAPDGSLSAKAIYYRALDSEDDLESGVTDSLEGIREANQVFTVRDCKAGGFGAIACEAESRTCGVISGEGFWACCQPEDGGLCHVVTAGDG